MSAIPGTLYRPRNLCSEKLYGSMLTSCQVGTQLKMIFNYNSIVKLFADCRALFFRLAAQSEVENLTLWGNYSIPKDNLYYTDNTFRPEVYSYGHRNPRRCSFDSERPAYLFCGDISEVIASSDCCFSIMNFLIIHH